MKKSFIALAAALTFSVGAHAQDQAYKSPVKTPGYGYEVIALPDVLTLKTKDGANKYAIDEVNYPWISYDNPSSAVDDGTAEVQQANRWTNLNPFNETSDAWLQVYGNNASVNAPVVCAANADGHPTKTITFYVENVAKFKVFATGSAGGSAADGNHIKIVATPTEGEAIEVVSPRDIYGKGTVSDSLAVTLDPAKKYAVSVTPTVKDIMLTGIQLIGTDTAVLPLAVKSPVNTPGFPYEVIALADVLTQKPLNGANKPAIDNVAYPWISYVNPTSTLDDGSAEVQQSNRWTNLNPFNEEATDWLQVYGNNGSVNAPVVTTVKSITFTVADANLFKVFATGSAGGSAADDNHIKVTAVALDHSAAVQLVSPRDIYGKGTVSDYLDIALKPELAYNITVVPTVKDIMLTGIQLGGVDQTVTEVAFKAPAPGEAFYETVLTPDVLTQKTKDGANKYAIDGENYPWVGYTNPSSSVDDGTAEVQTSNRWTTLDPAIAGTPEAGWLQVKGQNGSVIAPVVHIEEGNTKSLIFNVQATSKLRVFATGSASGSAADGNHIQVKAIAFDHSAAVDSVSPRDIYGKGTVSDSLAVYLNPAKQYYVIVTPTVKDIQITGINLYTQEGLLNEMGDAITHVYDFEAAGKAEEELVRLTLPTTQFGVWESEDQPEVFRLGFRGYTDYVGVNLPSACHVWRHVDNIDGSLNEEGLICNTSRQVVIDGLSENTEVTVTYTSEAGDELLYTTSASAKTVATIDGEAAVAGESTIASDAAVVVKSTARGYIAFRVFDGITIQKIVVSTPKADSGDATGIQSVGTQTVAAEGIIYNLAGQRVATPQRGQIYIQNGKKYIAK